MIVALAGVFAERSGIINLALEGIMIFGAFIGVLFVRQMQQAWISSSRPKRPATGGTLQGLVLLAMLVVGGHGRAVLAAAGVRVDQPDAPTRRSAARRSTCMAPALVLFFIRIIANQNTPQHVQRRFGRAGS